MYSENIFASHVCGSFWQYKSPVEAWVCVGDAVEDVALYLDGEIAFGVWQRGGGHADHFDRFFAEGEWDEVGVCGEAFEVAGLTESCAVLGDLDAHVDFAFSLTA